MFVSLPKAYTPTMISNPRSTDRFRSESIGAISFLLDLYQSVARDRAARFVCRFETDTDWQKPARRREEEYGIDQREARNRLSEIRPGCCRGARSELRALIERPYSRESQTVASMTAHDLLCKAPFELDPIY